MVLKPILVEVVKLQTSESEIEKRYYTTAALKDELAIRLSSTAEYHIDPKFGHIEIDYKYYAYARKLLYLTGISINEFPVFEIQLLDISKEVQFELEQLDDETLNEVVVDAISRLYESINFRYFHTSSIGGKIRWKFV